MKFTDIGEIDIVVEDVVLLDYTKRKDSGPVNVLVRPIELERLALIFDGFAYPENPDAKPSSPADNLKQLIDWQPRAAQIASAGIIGPKFNFEQNGKAEGIPWLALPLPDRTKVVNRILALSGMRSEATEPVRTFPEPQGGGDDGAGA